MIVLHFPPDTARRIVDGEQTVVTYPDRRLVWHHGVVPLTDLVGQPVGIAGLPDHTDFDGVNGWFNVSRPVVPGAIVGSGKVAVVVPVDDLLAKANTTAHGDLTPGRIAVILTDAAPCEQRCPVCAYTDGHHLSFGGIAPDHHVPIPYDHPGSVSEWTP